MDPQRNAVDAPLEDNGNTEEDPYLVENSTLDLDSYAKSYTGLTRLYRLMHIADHCPSLRVEALKMAITDVMQTCNVVLYQELHKKLQESIGGLSLPDGASGGIQDIPPLDLVWIESRKKEGAMKQGKLDKDLKNNCRSNSIKECIRRIHDELGDHHLNCGDLDNALKYYLGARHYCTSGKNVISVCLNVIKVSVFKKSWVNVLYFVKKAEATPELSEVKEGNRAIITRLKCAAGLAELATSNYKTAANHFLQANLCGFPDLLSCSNVVMYCGLCALATFDRQELQEHVILNRPIKLLLNSEPELRDIIFNFNETKYSSCLKLLDDIKNNLYLDMYLAPHVNTLYAQIRKKAIMQYFRPYSSADMRKMAEELNTSVPALEDELMELILDGQIQARIDSCKKILYAKDIDQRVATFEKALEVCQEYRRGTRMLMLRAAMIKNRIEVKSPHRENSQGGNFSRRN